MFFLASCVQAANVVSTETAAPTQTPTSIPPTPTITPLPTLSLSQFTPIIAGVATHGNMACLNYQGNTEDLDKVSLKAYFSQDSKSIENSVSSEIIDGKTCFEMVDAKYQPEISVSVIIKSTSDSFYIENGEQTFDLGGYAVVPFLQWIYPTALSRVSPYTKSHLSWDFQPKTNEQYSQVADVPLLSPVSGCVIWITRDVPRNGKNLDINNIEIYSPQTGYIIQLGHSSDIGFVDGQQVDLSKIKGNVYEPGEQISFLGPLDEGSGYPHTHMSVGVPPFSINCKTDDYKVVDAINKMQVMFDSKFGHIDFVKVQYMFLDPVILEYVRKARQD